MNRLIQKFLDHKKIYVFLICAFLFIVLQADGCFAGPAATPIQIINGSSVTIKGVFLYGDASQTIMLAPGAETDIKIGGGDSLNYTFVAKPMEDWLAFAKEQRDILIAHLAKAKKSGNAADIKAVTNQLKVVKARIVRLEARGGKSSCSGVANGNPVSVDVFNGEESYSLRARCSNSTN